MRFVILLIVSLVAGQAAYIQMDAGCMVGFTSRDFQTQSGVSACQVGNLDSVYASVVNDMPTYTPQSSAAEYARLFIRSTAMAQPTANFTAMVRSTNTITEHLATAGPSRPGLLYIDAFGITGSYQPGEYAAPYYHTSFRIGDNYGLFGMDQRCRFWIGTWVGPCNNSPIAFQLGENFDVQAQTWFDSGTTGTTGTTRLFMQASLPVLFRFTELDGAPVPIVHNSEPGTLVLAVLGVTVLCRCRRSPRHR